METNVKLTGRQDLEYPPILYKYRDWDNPYHKVIITDSTLYLASPKSFEDINDCNLPEKFPAHNKLYKFFLEKSKEENPFFSRKEHRNFANYWSKHSPLANPHKLKSLLDEINNKFHNCFGILSMTGNADNDKMWNKYGNEHKGFCVGYDTETLFQYVGGGGYVQYADELPTIDFVKDDINTKLVKNILFKERKWEFEEEYRLHKMWSVTATDKQRNIKLPNDCIVEIILGKLMSQESKDEIKKIAKDKYPKAKIIERIENE